MSEGSAALRAALHRDLARWREVLIEQHGWTHLEIECELDPQGRRIVARGRVLVDRLRDRLAERVREHAGPGWTVDVTRVRLLEGDAWFGLASATPLSQGPPDRRSLIATDVVPSDGPVERLARLGEGVLVRLRDGTVGWVRAEALTPAPVGPRLLCAPVLDQPGPMLERARARLGVPYRLGGTTDAGIDCSGLVQRAYAEALGVLLPRHTTDQLAVAPRSGAGPGAPGDLVFAWILDETRAHVGIEAGGGILHASRVAGAVVEEPRGPLLARARRVMHVRFADLLAFGREVAGHPSLGAAGFVLGRRCSWAAP